MPYKSSYGYSGKAKKKGSTATIVMAAAAGVAGGVVLGVGGYYAYNRYQESVAAGQRGVGYGSVQWCRVPPGRPNEGGMIECPDCVRMYGSTCHNQDSCFNSGGCSYTLPSDTVRDDLMATGFIPNQYKSPMTIKISSIAGTEFQASTICPKLNNVTGQTANQWVSASSFQTNLFVTLSEMDVLASTAVETCLKDTRSRCSSVLSRCGSHETCVSGWCVCKSNYCFNQNTFKCGPQSGTASSAPFQAAISWAPLAVVLISLRALRRLF